jgi:hypothetical protein
MSYPRTIAAQRGAADRPLVPKPAHCSGGRGMALITEDTGPEKGFALTVANCSGTSRESVR